MQTQGSWGETIEEDLAKQHLMLCWDFEELLADLRCHPVLNGRDSKSPIIAKEYFARA